MCSYFIMDHKLSLVAFSNGRVFVQQLHPYSDPTKLMLNNYNKDRSLKQSSVSVVYSSDTSRFFSSFKIHLIFTWLFWKVQHVFLGVWGGTSQTLKELCNKRQKIEILSPHSFLYQIDVDITQSLIFAIQFLMSDRSGILEYFKEKKLSNSKEAGQNNNTSVQ